MIDLEKLRERVEYFRRRNEATPISNDELLELLDHIGGIEAHFLNQLSSMQWEFAQLEKDAGRFDWLESSKEGHGFCSTGYGEYLYYVHRYNGALSVREVIDAAMEAKHG